MACATDNYHTHAHAHNHVDTITQFWKSSHKWQQLTLSLCWRSRDASGGASLLRAFPVLVDEDQGSGGLADTDSLWMAGGLKEEEGKPLYMLQHVLLLHPRTDEVHVFNTAGSRKKASSSGEPGTPSRTNRACNRFARFSPVCRACRARRQNDRT